MGEWTTPGGVLALALRPPAGSSGNTPVPAGGRRAQVRRPRLRWAPRESHSEVAPGALPRQGWDTGPPELGAQGREAELRATAGLTLFPRLVSTRGRAVPRRGQRCPPAGLMPSARLYPGNRFLSGQRAPRRRGRVSGDVNCGARAPGPDGAPQTQAGARSSAWECAPRRLPPAARPRPAPLPGFSLASAEEVAEDSVRTLGSLCERPRDTRQPLRSSDAAMGPAGAGASWREPRGIRASEAAKVTGEGAGGGVFLKRKIEKAKEMEAAGGRGRGRFRAGRQWPRGCSEAHPGARGLALLFIRVYSHSSVSIPGEKKKLN